MGVSPGEVREVSSSHCFPLPVIWAGRVGDGEDDGVTYEETGFSSSEDEEGGGGDNGEEGGKRSWVLKLSQMNARQMT